VAQPAVDQLRGGARRSGAEVAAVDQGDIQTQLAPARRDRRTEDAAADDEQVERLSLEPVEDRGPAPISLSQSQAPRR